MHLPPSSTLLSLLLPLTTTASPVTKAPSTTNDGGCTDSSFHTFSWFARAFDFHASYIFTTPAHQNSWGYASFDLFNPADDSTTHCEAQSNQLSDFFYGTVAYRCNDTDAERVGSTSFDFSRPSGQLRVNQTWMCDDQDPQWPVTFTGRGEVNLMLDCDETNYQNLNWTMGQIYSSREINCAPVETKIVPTELSAVA